MSVRPPTFFLPVKNRCCRKQTFLISLRKHRDGFGLENIFGFLDRCAGEGGCQLPEVLPVTGNAGRPPVMTGTAITGTNFKQI